MDTHKTFTAKFNKIRTCALVEDLGVNRAYYPNFLEVRYNRSKGSYRLEGSGQYGATFTREGLLEVLAKHKAEYDSWNSK